MASDSDNDSCLTPVGKECYNDGQIGLYQQLYDLSLRLNMMNHHIMMIPNLGLISTCER